MINRAARLFSDSLLSVAYPQPCLLCGDSVESRELGIACDRCWDLSLVSKRTESVCWKCGVTASGQVPTSNQELVRCHRCDGLSFSAARACGVYEGVLRELVLKLKREPYLPERLCKQLIETAQQPPLDICTRVLPVPLHPQRRKTRGFNQASVLASTVAQALRLPFDEVSLIRIGMADKYRAGLDEKGRQDTVAGVFEVRHPNLIKTEDILLVDDVFTTGSTVSNCGEALLAAGARTVFVLTVARPAR